MDKNLVDRTARLARLDLSREEARLLSDQIVRILEHFNRINALDTGTGKVRDGVARGTVAGGPLRMDRPGPSLPRSVLLANTDYDRDGCYSVRRVIDRNRDD